MSQLLHIWSNLLLTFDSREPRNISYSSLKHVYISIVAKFFRQRFLLRQWVPRAEGAGHVFIR